MRALPRSSISLAEDNFQIGRVDFADIDGTFFDVATAAEPVVFLAGKCPIVLACANAMLAKERDPVRSGARLLFLRGLAIDVGGSGGLPCTVL